MDRHRPNNIDPRLLNSDSQDGTGLLNIAICSGSQQISNHIYAPVTPSPYDARQGLHGFPANTTYLNQPSSGHQQIYSITAQPTYGGPQAEITDPYLAGDYGPPQQAYPAPTGGPMMYSQAVEAGRGDLVPPMYGMPASYMHAGDETATSEPSPFKKRKTSKRTHEDDATAGAADASADGVLRKHKLETMARFPKATTSS